MRDHSAEVAKLGLWLGTRSDRCSFVTPACVARAFTVVHTAPRLWY